MKGRHFQSYIYIPCETKTENMELHHRDHSSNTFEAAKELGLTKKLHETHHTNNGLGSWALTWYWWMRNQNQFLNPPQWGRESTRKTKKTKNTLRYFWLVRAKRLGVFKVLGNFFYVELIYINKKKLCLISPSFLFCKIVTQFFQ